MLKNRVLQSMVCYGMCRVTIFAAVAGISCTCLFAQASRADPIMRNAIFNGDFVLGVEGWKNWF